MADVRIGSLFSGYGGLCELAAAPLLGGSVAWHCEISPEPARILEHHWPSTPNLGDISLVDWQAVEPVDVLTGGFPCQDVSTAGKRAGLKPGTRTGLWSQMAYAVAQLRPRLVVIENVRGLLSAPAHSDLEPCPWCLGDESAEPALRALGAVLGDLAALGYDARWTGVRAADIGAPHGRWRVWIVAFDTRHSARRPEHGGEPGPESRPSDRAGEPGSGSAADARNDRPGIGGQPSGGSVSLEPAHDGHAAADARGESGGLGAGLRPSWPAGIWRGRSHDQPGPAAADSDEPGSPARHDARSHGREPGSESLESAEPAGRFLAGLAAHAESRGRGPIPGQGKPESARHDHRSPAAHAEPVPPGKHRNGGGLDRAPGRGRGSDRHETRAGSASRRDLSSPGAPAVSGRGRPDALEWGPYRNAVERWERLTRPAPAPTEPGPKGALRLSPGFVEWMMGLPAGHVTAVPGISRSHQLKALGNGVCPQQAMAAIRLLLGQP